MADLLRPRPPESLLETVGEPLFVPAPEIIEWARASFIEEGAPLYNEEHAHLNFASIGALWTNVGNSRQGRTIVGQCELGQPRAMMGKWPKARAEMQLLGWFGEIPDFVLTFDAHYSEQCSDAEWAALCEHELLHAGQEKDKFGAPKFRQDGRPAFAIRPHDVQEFTSIVRRYGADAAHVREFVDAANAGPEIANVRIAQACGTCMLRAA
ncbi:putative metallopeptidase [Chelativorans sp. AA-79]|uniref:putative metallopeptidase n=1 Tax=Chelativorans sp. AA-79 TaxID=3028735 RepID=UPI0023FA0918|nr:putative metallopeptidase [Chelativorans sp. AA-79]WEX10300.1 putative metallopeptidase [Chelativorans sp. AA-79]